MAILIFAALICGGLFLLARAGDIISLSRGTHRWQYRQRHLAQHRNRFRR